MQGCYNESMSAEQFIRTIFKEAFEKLKEHYPIFLKIGLFYAAVEIGTGIVNTSLAHLTNLVLFLNILSFILVILVGIGIFKISFKILDKKKYSLVDIYSPYQLFFKYLLLVLITTLAVFGGFLLLVIPGIIVVVRLYFAPLLMIDKGLGINDSIRESWKMTKGVFFKVLLFLVITFLPTAVIVAAQMIFKLPEHSFITYLISTISTLTIYPFTTLASATLYRRLLKNN